MKVFAAVDDGMFGKALELKLVIDSIRHNNDKYLVCQDFISYCDAQQRVIVL